jgi:hypothetical protein
MICSSLNLPLRIVRLLVPDPGFKPGAPQGAGSNSMRLGRSGGTAPRHAAGVSDDELTAAEIEVLCAGDDPLARTLIEQAALIQTSLPVSETARPRGVWPGALRGRLRLSAG